MIDLVALTEWAWLFGVLGLAASFGAFAYVKRQPPGNQTMIDLGELIHEGAMAFLRREYMVLVVFMVVVTTLLTLVIGTMPAVAYVFGALSSMAAGFIGMKGA